MDATSLFPKIAIRIIEQQSLVIGPLAWSEAKKVDGLLLDDTNHSVTFSGDNKVIIDNLIAQYEKIFGKVAHEASKDVVGDLIAEMSPEEIPSSLK